MPNQDDERRARDANSPRLFNTEISVSRDRKHACAKRELRMRREVYPGRVLRGVMTQTQADEEIAVMEAIMSDYAEKN